MGISSGPERGLMEIKIDQEFKDLIPAISEEELKGLEESIIKEGCRDPLVLWDDIIIDGHNRFDICTRHEIKFKTVVKGFDDRDQAKLWIICNQLSRRNLPPIQMSYLRGLQYTLEKKEHGGQIPGSMGQNDPSLTTAERIAEQHHVSPATVKRDAKFAEAVDQLPPEEKKEVLSGKSEKTKSELIGRTDTNGGEEKPLPKIGPHCIGMQYARIAILNLRNIREDDLERREAFEYVKQWIAEHEV